jgi:aerobic-type carbon monoxide dehydrogenase small subunit (CoxS/CutS family)
VRVALRVNGEAREVEARSDDSLLAVLRGELGLKTVRETCGIGVCGSCTVLVDGEPWTSCIVLVPLVEGREIMTVEALEDDDPVRRSFARTHAYQCGWCTPAMMLTARQLLEENPDPSEEEIRLALAGNSCRCGSYLKIVDAVRSAAAEAAGADGKGGSGWTS